MFFIYYYHAFFFFLRFLFMSTAVLALFSAFRFPRLYASMPCSFALTSRLLIYSTHRCSFYEFERSHHCFFFLLLVSLFYLHSSIT